MHKRHFAGLSLLLTALCTNGHAVAADDWTDGLYLKALGGVSYLRDDDANRRGTGQSSVDFDAGAAAGLSIGYELTENISAEIEYMYRTADVDTFGNRTFGNSGDFASVIVTANLLYQFDGWDVGLGNRVRPFAGLGLGVTQEIDFDISGGAASGEFESSGDFVYQLRTGANWELTDSWILSGELRYVDAGSPSLSASAGGSDLDIDYRTIDLLFGVAYRF